MVRDEYQQLTAAACDEMYGTELTFSTLQDSGEYET
jgi:hypothetical protein